MVIVPVPVVTTGVVLEQTSTERSPKDWVRKTGDVNMFVQQGVKVNVVSILALVGVNV